MLSNKDWINVAARQLRYLDYISQFSTDIRHVSGTANTVADALSRIEIDTISLPTTLIFEKFASEQANDQQLKDFLKNES